MRTHYINVIIFCVFTAAFYCFQHAGMEQRPRRARKRSFGDKDLLQKLAPILGTAKAPQQLAGAVGDKDKFLSPSADGGGASQVDGVQVGAQAV